MVRVLLVEPNARSFAFLQREIARLASVDACVSFIEARHHLEQSTYDRLISNLRLQAFHGLHLVYVAPSHTRSIIYTDVCEVSMGSDVQRAGAFYEWRGRLESALPGYLDCALPPSDRRNPACPDRRRSPRPGRRCSDPALPVSRDKVIDLSSSVRPFRSRTGKH